MVRLEQYQGFASDLAASGCLLLSSVWESREHHAHENDVDNGRRLRERFSSVKWNVVGDLVMTWLLTFPGCGLIGYGMAKLFILIF